MAGSNTELIHIVSYRRHIFRLGTFLAPREFLGSTTGPFVRCASRPGRRTMFVLSENCGHAHMRNNFSNFLSCRLIVSVYFLRGDPGVVFALCFVLLWGGGGGEADFGDNVEIRLRDNITSALLTLYKCMC
jgi:hypothetical protein